MDSAVVIRDKAQKLDQARATVEAQRFVSLPSGNSPTTGIRIRLPQRVE